MIPAIVFAWWHLKRNRLPVLSLLDAFSPSVALGLAIARIGCYMAGCCYGKPIETPAIAKLMGGSVQLSTAPLNAPLHPTQLYESAAAFVIFLFLIHQFWRNRTEGRLFCLMLILLAAARFVVELFRGDDVRGFIIEGKLSVPQFISGLILTAAVGLLLWINRSASQKSLINTLIRRQFCCGKPFLVKKRFPLTPFGKTGHCVPGGAVVKPHLAHNRGFLERVWGNFFHLKEVSPRSVYESVNTTEASSRSTEDLASGF